MFVYIGNICRAPMVHVIFEHLIQRHNAKEKFKGESSGTIEINEEKHAYSRMRKTSADHGIYINHLTRYLKKKDLYDYDLLLAMDFEKLRLFIKFNHSSKGKLEVPDPYYGGAQVFEEVFEMAYRTCKLLFNTFLTKPSLQHNVKIK